MAGITLVTSYLKSVENDAVTGQSISDRLEGIEHGITSLNEKVDKLDIKLDDHSTRITKIETEMNHIFRRLEKVEAKCDNRKDF